MEIYLPIAEMPIDMFLILGMGMTVGFISGMFGIGGGFLLTPLLIFVGIPAAVAVATQGPQIAASSVTGSIAYWRRRSIDFKLACVLIMGGLVGTGLGVLFFNHMRKIGQLETVQRAGNGFETLTGLGGLRHPGGQQAQAGMGSAADAPAQLVQLADSEPVGVHHDHHRRIGHVHPHLDDGGADQHVDLPGAERGHRGVLLLGGQSTVHETESQTRQRPVPQVLDEVDDGDRRLAAVL